MIDLHGSCQLDANWGHNYDTRWHQSTTISFCNTISRQSYIIVMSLNIFDRDVCNELTFDLYQNFITFILGSMKTKSQGFEGIRPIEQQCILHKRTYVLDQWIKLIDSLEHLELSIFDLMFGQIGWGKRLIWLQIPCKPWEAGWGPSDTVKELVQAGGLRVTQPHPNHSVTKPHSNYRRKSSKILTLIIVISN